MSGGYFNLRSEEIARKLEAVQTKEVLNTIYAVDEKGVGGANHKYTVLHAKEIPEYSQRESIKFIMSEMGDNVYPKFVKTILDLDEDYMRSKGIIED